MTSDEFHCVIVGDEPAGLWLAKSLCEGQSGSGSESRIGHVSFAELLPDLSVVLPVPLAEAFSLALHHPFSVDLRGPRSHVRWDENFLRKQFPELPTLPRGKEALALLHRIPASVTRALRESIRRHPQLLDYAQGLWKLLGRSETLQPEAIVLQACFATELAFWNPSVELPAAVTRFAAPEYRQGIDEVEAQKHGVLALRFRGLDTIRSRHWIFNLPWKPFSRLIAGSETLRKWIPLDGKTYARRSLYPLVVHADAAGIPRAAPLRTLYFDSMEIPEVDTEVWPVALAADAATNPGQTKTLTLWASAAHETDLDAVLEEFRSGMQRLKRLFPFLPQTLRSTSFPLDLASCHSDEARQRSLRLLEDRAVERYVTSSVSTETRNAAIRTLFPSQGSELPYPLGPLLEAQRLLPEYLGRKKKNQTPVDVAAPPSDATPTSREHVR